jgi:hypothetical protein
MSFIIQARNCIIASRKKRRGGETRRVEEDVYLDASVGGVMQIAVGDACLPLCATDN